MKPDAFFKRYGANRLLKLALILDTADAIHKEKGEPTYSQGSAQHPCRAPACAGGHWNHAMKSGRDGHKLCFAQDATWGFRNATDWNEIFGTEGCGNAQTAKEAAAYIRAFVKRKLKELSK